jgi:hypothetical protein
MGSIYDELCELGLNKVRQFENKVMVNWAITGKLDHTILFEEGIGRSTAIIIADGARDHKASKMLEKASEEDYYGRNN